ncbi:UNVERIFIED_CONTAM: ShlB/FhaC/HecB family hemolysin secretion/activation protein [Acinetobacter pittii]
MFRKFLIQPLSIYFICSSHYVYAIEDVSLPSQVLQDQRLKELNQQLQDQLAQQTPYQNTKPLQDFKRLVVKESPCITVKKISLIPLNDQSEAELQQFNFVVKAIKKHPQNVLGKCIGTQSLHNIVNYAQNELLKKGFITSQIVVSPQDLNQGNLNLNVQIGRLNKIVIQEGKISSLQLKTGLPFKTGDIVNLKRLDQGLENLKRVYAVDMQITPATAQDKELTGYSDLILKLQPLQKVNFNLSVDDSGNQDTGIHMGNIGIGINNPFHLNDILSLNVGHSLDDFHEDLNRSYFISYQLPVGYYDLGFTYNDYQYSQRRIVSKDYPIIYHGNSQQANLSLSRVISRSGQHKTSLYGKIYYKEIQSFMNDIEVEVLHRKTSGWNLGVQHRQYLGNAVLDGSIDYRRGMGVGARTAAEENITDNNGNHLPVEGYSRAPLLSADLRFSAPFLLLEKPAQYRLNWRGQYAPKILVPNDRFYIGGRYSVRGFDGELMLSGDNGQYLQQEISLNAPLPNTQFYMAVDQGWVNGRNSIPGQRYLLGSVLGLRTYQNSFYLDAFTGRGLIAPDSIKKDWVTGFSINLSY